eukprot:TRINITY_DN6610_c0_g1_i2.p1 TRINITY_DN6610_c0_g1~~TRINITY_DN6610_c0_g1_i2.p1  ORF type:complete len:686 (-),score=166.90 TRINITY_DN6610_c0_g1_i2:67-2124(-)
MYVGGGYGGGYGGYGGGARAGFGQPPVAPPAAAVYVYNGKRYSSLSELQADMSNSPTKRASLGTEDGKIRRVNELIEDGAKLNELVETLFTNYAGADKALQVREMYGLIMSLAAQLGFSDPVKDFGQVQQMFYAFDFSGEGHLDLKECELLVKFLLRKARDRLSPQPAMRLVNLPRKNLQEVYDLKKQLGQGGQGTVYLATVKGQSGPSAEKVVKFYSKSDANAPLDDIKDEFKLLKSLDHPAVARLNEIFEDNANVYVVSEPYFGGDLTTLVTNADKHGVTPTAGWVGRVFKQVVEGVVYLHDNAVMHCDLKEPNVMIAHKDASDWENPKVVIIDFGLAKEFSGDRQGGTPGYMPPEVWEGNPWNPKGDVFCLAVMFWDIFNGRQGGPFLCHDAPPYARIAELTRTAPMDCSKFPDGLKQLVEKMSKKVFFERPTARAVLQDGFFQSLSAQLAPVDASCLQALGNAAKMSNLQNLVACQVATTQNFAQLKELNNLFSRLDTDNDGTISKEEAEKAFDSLHLEGVDIQELVTSLMGSSGKVSYSDFMAQLNLAQRGVRQSGLSRIFAEFDTDDSGKLDRRELEALLAKPEMQKMMGGVTADQLLKEIDEDGSGSISFEEFRRAMSGEAKPSGWWNVGDKARYFSASYSKWLPCAVTEVNEEGGVMVDIKPGCFLPPHDAERLLIR